MAEQIEEIEKKIRTALDENIEKWEKIGKRHRYTYNILVVTSILLSLAITISGVIDQGNLTVVLGAILAGILSFQQVFPFREMSYFYRVGVAEAKILELNLDTRTDTIKEVEALEKRVETLIYKMAQDIPRGQALFEVIQNMREEVRN